MGTAEKQSSGSVVTLLTAEELRDIVGSAVRDAIGESRSPEGYLDTTQAAAYLGTTVASLRSAVTRGRIIPDHRGSRGGGMKGNRFSRETLDAFCNRKTK